MLFAHISKISKPTQTKQELANSKDLEKYRLTVRGFYVKNEWLMGSH